MATEPFDDKAANNCDFSGFYPPIRPTTKRPYTLRQDALGEDYASDDTHTRDQVRAFQHHIPHFGILWDKNSLNRSLFLWVTHAHPQPKGAILIYCNY